nr:hypothetical protein [Paraburkholderia domus]
MTDLVVSPDNEAEPRQALDQTLEIGKCVMHLLAPFDGLRDAISGGRPTAKLGMMKVLSTKRACRPKPESGDRDKAIWNSSSRDLTRQRRQCDKAGWRHMQASRCPQLNILQFGDPVVIEDGTRCSIIENEPQCEHSL